MITTYGVMVFMVIMLPIVKWWYRIVTGDRKIILRPDEVNIKDNRYAKESMKRIILENKELFDKLSGARNESV